PIRFLEKDDGSPVIYKMERPDSSVDYIFYIIPYWTDELDELLRGEIPGFTKQRQLRPLTVTQLGIKVEQFNYMYVGDRLADEQYLNTEHMVRVTVPPSEVAAFEFFLTNPPGIQVKIMFSFEAEKMDKYAEFKLTHKEVYDAITHGGAGRYKFSRAEISSSLTDYISKKEFEMKSKGDIQIPDVINRAIDECFTPVPKVDTRRRRPGYPSYPSYDPGGYGGGGVGIPYYLGGPVSVAPESLEQGDARIARAYLMLLEREEPKYLISGPSIPGGGVVTSDDPFGPSSVIPTPPPSGPFPTNRPSPWNPGGREQTSIEYVFKKEIVNSTKVFYYSNQHFIDTSVTAAVKVNLSNKPQDQVSKPRVVDIVKMTAVVEATATTDNPLKPGITVKSGEQYVLQSAFSLWAESYYADYVRKPFPWNASWESPDPDLYYRVGEGPWTPVNGRALIESDSLYKGELQFYIDKAKVWSKISKDYRERKYAGFKRAIFTYGRTFPQFQVTVTGRKIELRD
ncbi:MAG TPA: hypothetical protein PLH57_03490, partial [Oligoflexia bacterium]|nr:hypothetical protein [Oligoflexia bacterium]